MIIYLIKLYWELVTNTHLQQEHTWHTTWVNVYDPSTDTEQTKESKNILLKYIQPEMERRGL